MQSVAAAWFEALTWQKLTSSAHLTLKNAAVICTVQALLEKYHRHRMLMCCPTHSLQNLFPEKSGWRKRGNFCLHALVLSQAIIFSICHIVFSAHLEAQTVLRKRTKKFRCRLAVCAAVRGSLEESLGGLVFCMASSLAAHTRHLQGFQILPARAAFQGRSRTGIQPTTLQDLGHPVAAVFISEEAVLPDTCFSSYLLLCFFFTALISWKQYKLCQVSQAFEKSRFS